VSEVILWMADNLPIWRPFALALLGILFLACLWWAFGWTQK
jgi:hypothetical protein